MAPFKTLLFSVFFAGIFIFRPTTGRSIHLSVLADHPSKGLAGNKSDPPLSAVAADSSENNENGGHMVESEKHRHSSDKSVAGGGVIIGGLVTATFAAVYCYIRVTRKRDGESH